MARAFFTTDDGAWFTPTALARGPWDPDACHGGPPTALLVRAVEGLGDVRDDQLLARLTVELVRPVPMGGFTVYAEVHRTGRTATLTTATILDRDGTTCARAHGLHLATERVPATSAPIVSPDFERSVGGDFPVPRDMHDGMELFSHATEVRWDPGATPGAGGPTTMWMRTVPIVAGEDPSPVQRLAPLADCGNGISANDPFTTVTCINPDLTITCLREPRGDWFASRAATHAGDDGVGVAVADLFDRDGLVAHVTQTLVLRRP